MSTESAGVDVLAEEADEPATVEVTNEVCFGDDDAVECGAAEDESEVGVAEAIVVFAGLD